MGWAGACLRQEQCQSSGKLWRPMAAPPTPRSYHLPLAAVGQCDRKQHEAQATRSGFELDFVFPGYASLGAFFLPC